MTNQSTSARIKAAMPMRLASLRSSRGLTQEALAARIRFSVQSIYNCERGSHVPCTELLFALADALECSMDYLCGREEFSKHA